ncbi:MAG: tRNA pseudouridine(38-40) synthase TruA [Chloroflexi bacterium]|nr:tRNA pseudouridine(38-40) synthase TruA [Chloroflexota bacterium]
MRATIEYDGTAFAGSQVQPNARTVQGELEEALNRLMGERTRVRLAGRTDAGVHATGQVASFFVPRHGADGGWPELRRRLNGILPPDLAVRSLGAARADFDPRRDARWRVYRYRIRANGAKHPLDRHRTLEIDEPLDVAAMQAAANRMVGERDFASLGADGHGRTVRHVAEVRVRRRGDLVEVRVTANAFLRRMVRSIVAVLLAVGRRRLAVEDVDRLLAGSGRALAGRVVPAKGLTLERIVYAADNRMNQPRRRRTALSTTTKGMTGEQGT